MATNDEIYDDEIHELIRETRKGFECSCGKVFRTDYEFLAHIGKPVLYTQEDLDEAIQKAHANERSRIRAILEKAFAENTFYKCLDCGMEYKGKIDGEHSGDHTFTSRIVFESKSIKKLLAKIDEVN